MSDERLYLVAAEVENGRDVSRGVRIHGPFHTLEELTAVFTAGFTRPVEVVVRRVKDVQTGEVVYSDDRCLQVFYDGDDPRVCTLMRWHETRHRSVHADTGVPVDVVL